MSTLQYCVVGLCVSGADVLFSTSRCCHAFSSTAQHQHIHGHELKSTNTVPATGTTTATVAVAFGVAVVAAIAAAAAAALASERVQLWKALTFLAFAQR